MKKMKALLLVKDYMYIYVCIRMYVCAYIIICPFFHAEWQNPDLNLGLPVSDRNDNLGCVWYCFLIGVFMFVLEKENDVFDVIFFKLKIRLVIYFQIVYENEK